TERVGPLGIALPSNGTVVVTDSSGTVRRFPNRTDGQSARNATVVANYGTFNATGMAQFGQSIYMTQQINGAVIQLNADGTFRQTVVTGLPAATGIAVDPRHGSLFVSSDAGFIARVNPLTHTYDRFINNVHADGLAVSAAGTVLYAALADRVVGYSAITGTQVFNSGFIAGVPDGIALGTGLLAGSLFVNTNGGTVVQINLETGQQTVIASGGSRGDFVYVDPAGENVYITQGDRIIRI